MATLFQQFSSVSKAEWLTRIEKDLKGKAIESLNWQINDAISISPFAHTDDLKTKHVPITTRRTSNKWEMGVRIIVGDSTIANKKALNALSNGANAICFELNKSPSKAELQTLLKDIQLEWISTHFLFKKKSWKRFMSFFVDYVQANQLDANKIACSFSFKGNIITNNKEGQQLQQIIQQLPKAQLLTVNARLLCRGNDFVVEELAQILLTANNYLNELNSNGLNVADFHNQIQFSIALSDSYFLNIAKIRALKLLWQSVLTAWDKTIIANSNIEVHLTTITQTEDENYNKIKATAQAMAAVIGGVTRLYIYPSDEFKDGIGSSFAQRVALNIQHIFQLESYMDKVVDPSAGSYYIENLTEVLAETAWKRFQNDG